jgi:acetate kinase
MGVELDPEANEADDPSIITGPGSPVTAYVVPAREDLTMARQARQLLGD